ncbi:hypothetical protein [Flavobacterium sp. PL02]|uniref:hypothetical protein n=1 Tax=Flavobacterium sp. PL02 TaxID=3088354 RepID=UPI002B22346B|nr:hypothetical protein [Flavobacterium sp. PL02]MEA9412681.1 hypothetical protein [Flavobacterium sp. PL02]
MKITIQIIMLFILSSVYAMHKLPPINSKNSIENKCSVTSVTLKTERIEKKRKFLFWKLPHKKIIHIDKVFDSNGKRILKKTTIQVCSSCSCDDIKYRRVKIVNNEIWIFHYNTNPEKGIIKRYDFCGKFLGQKAWEDESFNDY